MLLAAHPAELRVPVLPDGDRIVPVDCPARRAQLDGVYAQVFGRPAGSSAPPPLDPAMGGSVLAVRGRTAVAAASWTAMVEGTSEVVGVATMAAHRRRGLGAAVAAAAAAGAARGGADLVWLTPGDDGARRIYRALGFTGTG